MAQDLVAILVVLAVTAVVVPVVLITAVPRIVRRVVPSVMRALDREGLLDQAREGSDVRAEMEQLRERLAELEERSDFFERALADQRREALPTHRVGDA